MIVVAIIGILAAVAIPAYSTYTKKAKFTEVVQATNGIKMALEACYADQADFTKCTAGSNGVPYNISATASDTATTALACTTTATLGKAVCWVGQTGTPTTTTTVITGASVGASGAPVNGLTGEVYTLTASQGANGSGITWTSGGNCLAANICK